MLPHPPTTCTPKLLTSSLSALVTSSVVLLGPNPNCLLIRCSHPRRPHHHHSIHIESTTIQQDRKSIPPPHFYVCTKRTSIQCTLFYLLTLLLLPPNHSNRIYVIWRDNEDDDRIGSGESGWLKG